MHDDLFGISDETKEAFAAGTATSLRNRCRHIFADGRRCGAPSLRGPAGPEDFCYYHHTTRKPVQDPRHRKQRRNQITLPRPEDRSAVLASIAEVLDNVAMNRVDARRAGILLYGLQIANSALPKEQTDRTPEKPIEIVVDEPTLGLVGPHEPYSTRYERGMEREHSLTRNIKDLQQRLDKAQADLDRVTAERDAADESFAKLAARMVTLEAKLPQRTEAQIPVIQAVAETPKYRPNPRLLKPLRKNRRRGREGYGGTILPAARSQARHRYQLATER